MNSLAHKRGNVDGAALFWTVPQARSRRLIGLLAAYEMICDFLDSLTEPAPAADVGAGEKLTPLRRL